MTPPRTWCQPSPPQKTLVVQLDSVLTAVLWGRGLACLLGNSCREVCHTCTHTNLSLTHTLPHTHAHTNMLRLTHMHAHTHTWSPVLKVMEKGLPCQHRLSSPRGSQDTGCRPVVCLCTEMLTFLLAFCNLRPYSDSSL